MEKHKRNVQLGGDGDEDCVITVVKDTFLFPNIKLKNSTMYGEQEIGLKNYMPTPSFAFAPVMPIFHSNNVNPFISYNKGYRKEERIANG